MGGRQSKSSNKRHFTTEFSRAPVHTQSSNVSSNDKTDDLKHQLQEGQVVRPIGYTEQYTGLQSLPMFESIDENQITGSSQIKDFVTLKESKANLILEILQCLYLYNKIYLYL